MAEITYNKQVKEWPDKRLKEACQNLLDLHDTGVLPEGPVRELGELIRYETGVKYFLPLAERLIERESMKRYIEYGLVRI
jgi:hypothetical protein